MSLVREYGLPPFFVRNFKIHDIQRRVDYKGKYSHILQYPIIIDRLINSLSS